MLWCHSEQIPLQLVMNTEAKMEPAQDAIAIVAGMCPSLAIQPNQTMGKPRWLVLSTRTDFRATNSPWELNHFMPCVPYDEPIRRRLRQVNEAEQRERQDVMSMMEMIEADDDDQQEAMLDAYHEHLDKLAARSANLKRLVTRVHEASNTVPIAVKADGNCGSWSLVDMILMDEDPTMRQKILDRDALGNWDFLREESSYEHRMVSVRQRLSELWLSVAEACVPGNNPALAPFVVLFKYMVLDAGGLELPQPSLSSSSKLALQDAKDRQWKTGLQNIAFSKGALYIKMCFFGIIKGASMQLQASDDETLDVLGKQSKDHQDQAMRRWNGRVLDHSFPNHFIKPIVIPTHNCKSNSLRYVWKARRIWRLLVSYCWFPFLFDPMQVASKPVPKSTQPAPAAQAASYWNFMRFWRNMWKVRKKQGLQNIAFSRGALYIKMCFFGIIKGTPHAAPGFAWQEQCERRAQRPGRDEMKWGVLDHSFPNHFIYFTYSSSG